MNRAPAAPHGRAATRDPGLHELVIAAGAAHPARPAVVGPDRTLTYAELDRQADTLAHALAAQGVGRGDRVILWAEKSCRLVAAMQAVLRLGAAYVPLHESTPPDRAAQLVRDCAARVVCGTGRHLAEISARLGRSVGYLDPHREHPGYAPFPHRSVAPDDLAFILYTSGSTGIPKGVCVSHRNARAFVDWARTELAPDPGDRFSGHAPFSFDLSVLDLYGAFAAGAAVHLIPTELAYAPARLADFMHAHAISIWYSVPSALILMMRDGGLLDRPAPRALRAVLFAGEPFPIAGVRRLAGWTNARLLNLYGPTETNVCTFHEVTAHDLARDRPVPIGTAAAGDTVWAVDDAGPAGPGTEGELFVDGPSVMLGYWGHPRQRGPYATGDRVHVRADGSFEYLGRRDGMVKVRGQRIELGDVEGTIAAHPDVADVTVVVTGEAIESRLTAFVVPDGDARPGLLSIKRHCAERLPPYMIIDAVRLLPELPRTPHGKVDRPALAERLANADGTGAPAARPAQNQPTRNQPTRSHPEKGVNK